jgi:hypothetical protein
MLLVGTADGLLDLALDGEVIRRTMPGADVVAVSGDFAVAGGWVMALEQGSALPLPEGLAPRCVAGLAGGRALVGTSGARLVEVGGPDGARPDASFDAVPTRKRWSTPWGGPPDTRSVAIGKRGVLAGIHVGGVWRSGPDGWVEVVPAETDNHQVVVDGDTVAVAAAIGVGQSDDGGDTWQWSHEGLHAAYCRAAAIADGWLLASASTGPGSEEGAVYRRPLADPQAPFARCGDGGGRRKGGMPAAFPYNINTFALAAAGSLVAVGTPDGDLFLSDDSGGTWRRLAEALPGIHCVEFAA